jgi:hypothetical protein
VNAFGFIAYLLRKICCGRRRLLNHHKCVAVHLWSESVLNPARVITSRVLTPDCIERTLKVAAEDEANMLVGVAAPDQPFGQFENPVHAVEACDVGLRLAPARASRFPPASRTEI